MHLNDFHFRSSTDSCEIILLTTDGGKTNVQLTHEMPSEEIWLRVSVMPLAQIKGSRKSHAGVRH